MARATPHATPHATPRLPALLRPSIRVAVIPKEEAGAPAVRLQWAGERSPRLIRSGGGRGEDGKVPPIRRPQPEESLP